MKCEENPGCKTSRHEVVTCPPGTSCPVQNTCKTVLEFPPPRLTLQCTLCHIACHVYITLTVPELVKIYKQFRFLE